MKKQTVILRVAALVLFLVSNSGDAFSELITTDQLTIQPTVSATSSSSTSSGSTSPTTTSSTTTTSLQPSATLSTATTSSETTTLKPREKFLALIYGVDGKWPPDWDYPPRVSVVNSTTENVYVNVKNTSPAKSHTFTLFDEGGNSADGFQYALLRARTYLTIAGAKKLTLDESFSGGIKTRKISYTYDTLSGKLTDKVTEVYYAGSSSKVQTKISTHYNNGVREYTLVASFNASGLLTKQTATGYQSDGVKKQYYSVANYDPALHSGSYDVIKDSFVKTYESDGITTELTASIVFSPAIKQDATGKYQLPSSMKSTHYAGGVKTQWISETFREDGYLKGMYGYKYNSSGTKTHGYFTTPSADGRKMQREKLRKYFSGTTTTEELKDYNYEIQKLTTSMYNSDGSFKSKTESTIEGPGDISDLKAALFRKPGDLIEVAIPKIPE